ncbi:MAG: ribosome-associated translation inhibitor RaiA [Candidatus Pacebacteria bacterium]|nr:ribosome-associated translation inhibitor RaiA [Candidatus Paceibacterota bacterium]
MKKTIKATSIDLTNELSAYIEKKLGGLEKFINSQDESVFCDVEVARTTMHHKTGDIFRAEFHLHMAGKYLNAVSEKDSIFAALDEVKDEMAHELTAYKTKKNTLLKKGSVWIKKMLRRPPNQ